MTELERVDGEIRRWTERQTDFKAKLETTRAERERIEQERDAFLVAAKVEGDSTAQTALDQFTDKLTVAERDEKDTAKVLAQIGEKLNVLAGERTEALRAAKLIELKAMAAERFRLGVRITTIAAELRELILAWVKVSLQMDAVALDAGNENKRYCRPNHLRDSLIFTLFWPHWHQHVEAPHTAFRRPWLEIDREILADLLPQASDKKRGKGKQTADASSPAEPAAMAAKGDDDGR